MCVRNVIIEYFQRANSDEDDDRINNLCGYLRCDIFVISQCAPFNFSFSWFNSRSVTTL